MGVNDRDPSGLITKNDYAELIDIFSELETLETEQWHKDNAEAIKALKEEWGWWPRCWDAMERANDYQTTYAGLKAIRKKYNLPALRRAKSRAERVEAVQHFYADLCNQYKYGNDTDKWNLSLYVYNWDDEDPAQAIHGKLYGQTVDLLIEAGTAGALKGVSVLRQGRLLERLRKVKERIKGSYFRTKSNAIKKIKEGFWDTRSWRKIANQRNKKLIGPRLKVKGEYSWEHIISKNGWLGKKLPTPFLNSHLNSGFRIKESVNNGLYGWNRLLFYSRNWALISGSGYGGYKIGETINGEK